MAFLNADVPINLYSPVALEPWYWATPDQTGIGGSETAHIQLSERLAKRNYQVFSYNELDHDSIASKQHLMKSPAGVVWFPKERAPTFLEQAAIWINYRDAAFYDLPKEPGSVYWFIAQDVGYDFTPERLAKIDRYVCLCKEHARWTAARHPEIKDRIYVSTNGIRRDLIELVELELEKDKVLRNPKRCVYTSSPDRGLLFILQNWFRILEAVPDAELHVHYGFKNMETIENKIGGPAGFSADKTEIQRLLKQKGITFNNRTPQADLIKGLFQSQLWLYPTDWPETSCITCMEMQACGAIPVTNNYWAVGENVFAGTVLPGIPQKNEFIASMWVGEVIRLLENPGLCDRIRHDMMTDARDTFDWDKIIDNQIVPWLIEDISKVRAFKAAL